MNPLNSCSVDEFRMFYYKVIPCRKHYSHDWSDCPFAHAGEKACRRCPRTHMYTGLSCPDMKKNGECPRGDKCHFSHNSFEYWLHPSRYRSQFCTFGTNCRRPVCFFAHTIEELRMPNAPVKPGKGLVAAFPDLPDAMVPDMFLGDGSASPFDELMQAPGMFQQQLVPRNNMQQQYMDPMTCEVSHPNEMRVVPEPHYAYIGYNYSAAQPTMATMQKPQDLPMSYMTASPVESEVEAMMLSERSSGSLDAMRPMSMAGTTMVRSPVNNPTLMVRRMPAPAPMTIGRSAAYCAGDMLPVQEQYNSMGWPMQAV